MGGPGSGRIPRPVEEHVARGTFRRDRHGDGKVVSLPPSPAAPPAAPSGLRRASRDLWTRYVTAYDGWGPYEFMLLEQALRAGDRAADCRRRVARDGIVVTGKRGGGRRAHPLLKILRSEERFMLDVFRQLGLSR